MIPGLDIDHIMISSDDPARDLGAARDSTGFPEAWPYEDFGAIRTGALWAGRTAIEFARLDGAPTRPGQIAGLALSSNLEPWPLAEALRQGGISHVPPTHVAPDPQDRLSWTNTVMRGFLDSEPKTLWLGRHFGGQSGFARWLSKQVEQMAKSEAGLKRMHGVLRDQMVFFIEFAPIDEAERRRTEAIERFRCDHDQENRCRVAIEICMPPDCAEAQNWHRLLDMPVAQDRWTSPSGTELRFRAAPKPRLEQIVIEGIGPPSRPLPDYLARLIKLG